MSMFTHSLSVFMQHTVKLMMEVTRELSPFLIVSVEMCVVQDEKLLNEISFMFLSLLVIPHVLIKLTLTSRCSAGETERQDWERKKHNGQNAVHQGHSWWAPNFQRAVKGRLKFLP